MSCHQDSGRTYSLFGEELILVVDTEGPDREDPFDTVTLNCRACGRDRYQKDGLCGDLWLCRRAAIRCPGDRFRVACRTITPTDLTLDDLMPTKRRRVDPFKFWLHRIDPNCECPAGREAEAVHRTLTQERGWMWDMGARGTL